MTHLTKSELDPEVRQNLNYFRHEESSIDDDDMGDVDQADTIEADQVTSL